MAHILHEFDMKTALITISQDFAKDIKIQVHLSDDHFMSLMYMYDSDRDFPQIKEVSEIE